MAPRARMAATLNTEGDVALLAASDARSRVSTRTNLSSLGSAVLEDSFRPRSDPVKVFTLFDLPFICSTDQLCRFFFEQLERQPQVPSRRLHLVAELLVRFLISSFK